MNRNNNKNLEKEKAKFASRIQKAFNALAGIGNNVFSKKYSIEIAWILLKLGDIKQSVKPIVKEYKSDDVQKSCVHANVKEDFNNALSTEDRKVVRHDFERTDIAGCKRMAKGLEAAEIMEEYEHKNKCS